MAKHTTLPQVALDGAAGHPAQDHLPTALPAVPTTPTPPDGAPDQHAIDAVTENVPTLGVQHLPDFFGLG